MEATLKGSWMFPGNKVRRLSALRFLRQHIHHQRAKTVFRPSPTQHAKLTARTNFFFVSEQTHKKPQSAYNNKENPSFAYKQWVNTQRIILGDEIWRKPSPHTDTHWSYSTPSLIPTFSSKVTNHLQLHAERSSLPQLSCPELYHAHRIGFRDLLSCAGCCVFYLLLSSRTSR